MKAIDLAKDHEYKRILKAIEAKQYRERPKFAHPATPEEVAETIERLKNRIRSMDSERHKILRDQLTAETRFLALWWLTACRPACLMKLEKENIEKSYDTTAKRRALSVTFTSHKTIASPPPYTVHTWEKWPELFVLKEIPEGRVFPDPNTSRRVTLHLKETNVLLEARSIRRGALIAMAMNNVDTKTLREFSRHTTDGMLMRYLDWGRNHGIARTAGVLAAAHL
jgi:hypothetical protein